MFKRLIPAAGALAACAVLTAAAPALADGHGRHHHHHAKGSHYSGDHHPSSNSNYCNHGNYGGHDQGDHGNSQHSSCSYGTYSAWDEEWLTTGLEGDLFEIAGGKLAQTHSSNATVKALGMKLMSDHAKSFQEAAELAKKLGIEVPDEPTPSEQWELQAVGNVSGKTFDEAYTSLEVADHKQDIKETKAELEKGCNPLIRHEAAEELPMLEEHLKLSEAAFAAS